MDDPRPLPAADLPENQGPPEVIYTFMQETSQKGKVGQYIINSYLLHITTIVMQCGFINDKLLILCIYRTYYMTAWAIFTHKRWTRRRSPLLGDVLNTVVLGARLLSWRRMEVKRGIAKTIHVVLPNQVSHLLTFMNTLPKGEICE